MEPVTVVPTRGRGTVVAVDDPREWDADEAVTVLHAAHYRALVRSVALMTGDAQGAEEVVQDAFVGLHRSWARIRDPERAIGYLRRSAVNGARSRYRRASTARRHAPLFAVPDVADPADDVSDHVAVLAALAALPERQREVLVLRYYDDLSEAAIAEALGISTGAVKTHASRGLAALRPRLETVR
jgi:RNA polymerase sigma-70 factor (sigma-E family)